MGEQLTEALLPLVGQAVTNVAQKVASHSQLDSLLKTGTLRIQGLRL